MIAAAQRETSRAVARRVVVVTGLLLTLFTVALAGALFQLRGAQQNARDAVAGQARAADAASLRAEREHQGAVLSQYLVDHDDADIAEYRAAQRRSHGLEARLAAAFPGNRSVREALALGRKLDVDAEESATQLFEQAYKGRFGLAYATELRAEDFVAARVSQAAIVREAAEAAAHREVEQADERLAEIRRLLVMLACAVLGLGTLLAARLVRIVGRSFRRLGESEERFRTLVGNIQGAVYRRPLDPAAPMEFISDSIEQISGFGAAEFQSGARRHADLLADGQRELLERATAAAVQRGAAFSVEYEITHADGSSRWVRDMGQAVRGGDGEVARLDGTISDVSELKRLELDLRVAQKLEAVGQLAAGIAHEINTPIQFVGDSVGFLRESFADLHQLVADYDALCRRAATGRPDADAILIELAQAKERADLEYLEQRVPGAFARTADGIGRVATIVAAMRDFGRPAQVSQEPADLNHALSSTLVVARHAYKDVAEVETELGQLPLVLCNVSDLNQVFLNLIVNAAHAIEDASGAGTIGIRTAIDEDAAVITISDTGTGIPADVRARIFDPFFTTKDAGRGTGQGLAIARSIVVDKHGGTLTVDSEPGRGTEFAIRLPLAGKA